MGLIMTHRYTNKHGAFEISSLPGQSQIAVCHSFFVHENERGHGHAHTLKAQQRHTLTGLHYDYAICTVSGGNAAQKAVLAQSGWTKLAEFPNHRSSETTEIWGAKP
jgi:hypothetical protein